jgi:DHA1 family tetracycline resistance protein-like MFS transporter
MDLRKLDKRLVTILLIVFVQMVGASMILPIIPLFAKNEFEMSATLITLLVASFYAAQFIGGPILGRWSDRIGRVPVLVVSQVGTVVSFVMFGMAGAVWVLFAARILDGLTGGNIVVAQAYVTDITPKEKRAQALGLVFAAFGVAFFVGPAIGGILVGFGPRVPYFIAAVAAAAVVLLTVFTLDESMSAEERAEHHAVAEKLSFLQAIRVKPLMLALRIVSVRRR